MHRLNHAIGGCRHSLKKKAAAVGVGAAEYGTLQEFPVTAPNGAADAQESAVDILLFKECFMATMETSWEFDDVKY